MKIQVLGSGCPTCKKLNEMTVQAVTELGLPIEIEYLIGEAGITKIVELGIMNSPVLTVNGKPVMVGFTPDIERVKSLIQKAIQK